MAEALLNKHGNGRFRAFSAGSHPKAAPHPFALERVAQLGFDPASFRSKSWDEFGTPDAPPMDMVITVCDSAAGESCPVWPGQPVTAHWSFPDPSETPGSDDDKRAAFQRVFIDIQRRIELLANLPSSKLEHASLKHELSRIAADTPATAV